MKSILQTEKECFITGSKGNLHEHHVFGGINRKISEKYGLKIWLRADFHVGNNGIHFDQKLDQFVKEKAQKAAMERYGWTKEEFIKMFGRNYL